jgi:hypothetical protein
MLGERQQMPHDELLKLLDITDNQFFQLYDTDKWPHRFSKVNDYDCNRINACERIDFFIQTNGTDDPELLPELIPAVLEAVHEPELTYA